ncbi:MAG: GAF domain-containing protein [Ktedonobacterales bacterium]|nr:GAF domain-containing protein [Ktedonobacterales bacterium]
MSTHDPSPDGEHWYGAQEAALYLGIHRSTLHLSVHRRLLIPDMATPGGHFRFKEETLKQFRVRLAHGAATSETAILAPIHAIARITSGISAREPAEEICRAAAEGIRHAQPDIDAVLVALHDPGASDPYSLRLVAEAGPIPALWQEHQRLRGQGVELATTHAMRTLECEIVEDTEARPIRFGSARIARAAKLRSYAVQPLLNGTQVLGVLMLASRTPHRFVPGERIFLDAVVDELALALRIEQYLALTRHLILCAMGWGSDTEPAKGQPESRLGVLRDFFITHTGAEDACAVGFDDGGCLDTPHPRLRALAERALASEGYLREEWEQDAIAFTGMAASVALRDGHLVSGGAIWRGKRPSSQSDHSLLLVFVGACVLAAE